MYTFSEFLERHTDFIKNAKQINFQWYQIEIITKLVRDHFDFDERVKVYDVINSYLVSDDVSNSPYARTLKQNRRPSEAELKKLRGSIFYEVVGKITAMKTERENFSPLSGVGEQLSDDQIKSLLVRSIELSGKCDKCVNVIGRFRANLVCGHLIGRDCLDEFVRKTGECPICKRVV